MAVVGLSLALTPVASATSSSFTWAGASPGQNESAARWSVGANWEGDTAPSASQSIETLTFPHLTNSECTSKPETDACYFALNDLSGLSVDSLQLDDGDDYLLAGEKIALGSGGLTATPPGGSGSAGSFMEMPLELDASQKWSIANTSGGEIEENGVLLGADVTGVNSELAVELIEGPALVLENSTEVGPMTIEGPSASGQHIANGSVLLEGGELNAADDQSVDLRNIYFKGAGAVGALKTNNATVSVGDATDPAGALKASSVTLDSASASIFGIVGSGTSAQIDYPQLVSPGPVDLAGVLLVLVSKPSAQAPCPVLNPGQKYTFVSTTGALSGTFANAPEGGPEIQIAFTKSCSHAPQSMRLSYNRSGATETVTGTVEAQVVERQEREVQEREGQERETHERETHERETKQKEEASKKLSEESTKKAAEEATIAETAAIKKHEEEAAASIARKRQEEETFALATKNLLEGEGLVVAGVTLSGSSITVANGAAEVKLTCTANGGCHGKLTLSAKGLPKRGKKAKTETIGTAGFSIVHGATVSVKLALNASGKSLLSADRGRLDASLAISRSSPTPSQTHTYGVQLVQKRRHTGAAK